MESITHYVEQRLKLRVNREKSVVDRATKRPFLGFGFLYRGGEVKVRVDQKARKRAKDRLRQLTSRRWGVSIERRITEINRFTVGWTPYFALADTPYPFEQLDEWLRRRLRQVRWKEWKRPRTRRRNLRALDINELNARQSASSRKGYWRIAGSWVLCYALPNAYWANLGLQGFADPYRRFRAANANRPVRTRTPGGVGGVGVSSAPTRSIRGARPSDARDPLWYQHGPSRCAADSNSSAPCEGSVGPASCLSARMSSTRSASRSASAPDAGHTARSTDQAPNATSPSPAGSTGTTPDDHTAPSATSHPSLASTSWTTSSGLTASGALSPTAAPSVTHSCGRPRRRG